MQFTTSITVGGQSVVVTVPRQSKAWRKANAIFCPLGPSPSKAWLLLTKSAVDALDVNGTHSIVWTEINSFGGTGYTFTGWRLVSAERLLHGGEGDTKALYLCEFADARWVAANTSDTNSLIKNIRSYANTATYLTGTSGATWESLGQELWNACGVLGSWPGLPAGLPIDGTPENTWLIGLNAWRALCAYLDQLDCAVKHDPLSGAYSIVQLGEAQTITATASRLKWNGETIRSACDSAANLRVWFYFHRKSYGQERDTELANNWAYNGQGDVKLVATGITGATGTKPLWDDLPWVLDEDGTHTNNGAVTTRADNRKSRYVTRRGVTAAHKIYAGIFNVSPGGQVRAVLWRNWDDGTQPDGSANPFGGTCTEYLSGPDLVTGLATTNSVAYGEAWFDREIGAPERENYLAPDLGRRSYANYPRLPNIVQVNVDGASAGDDVSANGDGFFKGRVCRWVNSAMVALDDCWIRFVDDHDVNNGDVTGVTQGEYYHGRLSGMDTSSPDSLPVYLARKGGSSSDTNIVLFELISNMSSIHDANARRLVHNPLTGLLDVVGAPIVVVTAWFHPLLFPGLAPYSDVFVGPAGCRGAAVYDHTDEQGVRHYNAIWMNRFARFLYVEVTGDYNAQNNTIECRVLNYWDQGYPPVLEGNNQDSITVYDPNNFFRKPHADDAKGIAVYRGDQALNTGNNVPGGVQPPRYDLLWLEQSSLTYTAELTADMDNDTATINIQSVKPMGWCLHKLIEDPFPNIVFNPRKLYGLKGDEVVIIVHADREQYEVIAVSARPTWGWAKLTETLEPHGTALARVWGWFAGAMTISNPPQLITIQDTMLDSALEIHQQITWDYDPINRVYFLRTHSCSNNGSGTVWGE